MECLDGIELKIPGLNWNLWVVPLRMKGARGPIVQNNSQTSGDWFLSTAKQGDNVFGSVHPSVRPSASTLTAEPFDL